jgi:7-cyano-7-deazaguanine synthase in queuosine biosynthesis
MSAPEATKVLVVCDGASVPPDLAAARWDRRDDIRSVGAKADLNLRIDTLSGNLRGSVSRRAEDLLYIACCCVAADQRINRGTKQIDVHRRRWRRQITLVIPVREPDLWALPDVMKALSQSLAFATEDGWSFSFVPREPDARPRMLFGKDDDRIARGNPDSVVLFSGGMDSLCATVDSIADLELQPIALSFKSANQVSGTQSELIEALRRHLPQWRLPHVGFSSQRIGGGEPDPSQRTRAFAFAALGCAVAESLGLETVVLADNGYVSINPPITGELAGALASRGTHPTLIRLINHLIQLVFDQPMAVVNPLADRTRAEALAILGQHDCAGLIELTMTCGKFRSPHLSHVAPHCGVCSQCVDRRFAVVQAGLEELDPAERYVVDIFLDELPSGEGQKIAPMYVEFAQRAVHLTPEEIFDLVDQLYACLDPEGENIQQEAYSLGHLLWRHSREVTAVLGEMIARNSEKLATSALPPTSLLRYASGGATSQGIAVALTPLLNVATDSRRPSMEKSGNYWHFSFQGEKATLRDLKGFTYLSMLLRTPGQELPATMLASGGTGEIVSFAEVAEDGLSMGTAYDEILPEDGEEFLTRNREQLAAELDKGVSPTREQEINKEIDQINRYIAKTKGLRGRRRGFPENAERARVSVTKAINRAVAELETASPQLHAHLQDTLTTGRSFIYAPRPPVHWDVAA